jgi:hypothetical protein
MGVVFAGDYTVWSFDVARGRAAEVPITLRGASASGGVDHQTLTNGFSSLALSPDDRKIAFVARGDVFAAGAREGGAAERITTTPDLETQLAWAPDSRRLVYVSSRDCTTHL